MLTEFQQRIHAANVEKFVPMVKEKLAGEVIHQTDEGEPRAEGEREDNEDTHSEENGVKRMK